MLVPPDNAADEKVEEKVEEVKDEVEDVKEIVQDTKSGLSDDDVNRISEKVYDRIKAFVGEMVKSADDMEQIVSEAVSSKAEEMAPALGEVETSEEEIEQDVKPKRSHKLFRRIGKKED